MCEPSHSIVQFDNPDNDITPGGRLGMGVGRLGKWFKRIGRFFHLSAMGAGHSQALNMDGRRESFLLPAFTNYETQWWERKVVRDGRYKGILDQSDSLQAATTYGNDVCIGNMTALRRFLETTLKATSDSRRSQYDDCFRRLLTTKGRVQYEKRLAATLHCKTTTLNRCLWSLEDSQWDAVIKVMLGFTRRRGLLVPCYADDNKLWSPGQ